MIAELPREQVSITLTRLERWVLLNALTSPALLESLRNATIQGGRVQVLLTRDQLACLKQELELEHGISLSPRHRLTLKRIRKRLASANQGQPEAPEEPPSKAPLSGHEAGGVTAGSAELPPRVMEAVAAAVQQYNTSPDPEMGGLSPHQVHTLICCGWWAEPFPIILNPNLALPQIGDAVFFHNARAFLRKVAEVDGLEATVQGNLSRKAVAQLIEALTLPADYISSLRAVSKVVNERDVFPVHVARIVCELGGLVRRRKKLFNLTRKGRGLLPEANAGELYRHLFEAFFRKFNLAYLGRLPELPGVQLTFPYMLYRLSRMSHEQTYTVEGLVPELFLPKVQEEISSLRPNSPWAEWVLESRILKPLEDFGLIEVTRVDPKDREPWLISVRKTLLFDAFVRIGLP